MNTDGRRSLLLGLCGAVLTAACSSAPVKTAPPPLAPLALERLDALATSAGLTWMVRVRPRAVAQIPWLIPAIARIVPEPHFDAFRDRSGLDPRQLHEVFLLRYGAALGNAEAQIVRHNADPAELERKFFARLTKDATRVEDRAELVRIAGTIGRSRHAFARLGKDVVVYQQGGEEQRGPVAIASLFAQGKLSRAPRLLANEPLSSLAARFGEAPVVALALGPFHDEWKAAAHGLLEIATAVGASARPTARDNVGVAIALSGGFGKDAPKAAEVLLAAWEDVAHGSLGRVLGLDHPVEPPLTAGDKDIVTLSVELAPDRLTEGLRALLEQDLEAIMKLD